MRTTFRTILATAAAALVVLAGPAHAADHPNVVGEDPANWTPHVLDGRVLAVVQVGGRMIVGGRFTKVANAKTPTVAISQANLVAFNATTGAIDPAFRPTVDKQVEALAVAPDGNILVGGQFAKVNGAASKGLVKLNASSGARVAGFRGRTNGRVMDLQVSGGRVYLAGNFTQVNGVARGQLAAVDPVSGTLGSDVAVAFTGPRGGGTLKVDKFDITPDGRLLVAIGNFTNVNGVRRDQVAVLTLNAAGGPATLNGWATDRYAPACMSVFPSYLHDVDTDRDPVTGALYAVIVTTGGPRGNLCDTAARFPLTSATGGQQPTWINATGGDTLWSVACTGPACYVGGHQRWMDNPAGADRPGPGAVAREGIAALDPTTGKTLTWNPGKSRGVGAFALVLTPTGLWVGSDTTRIGGETHRRIAFLPL